MSIRLIVAITDRDWFEQLRVVRDLPEVNFWAPSPWTTLGMYALLSYLAWITIQRWPSDPLRFDLPALDVPIRQYAEALVAKIRAAIRNAVVLGCPGRMRDPAEAWLFAPIGRACEAISGWVDRLQFLTIRRLLSITFGALVLFLAAVAVLEQL